MADRVGYQLLVADTVNHLLRGVRLADGHVTTVAGTGEQFMVGAPDNVLPGDEPTSEDYGTALRIRLSSPWDVAWSPELAAFVVAMAGHHTLWTFDPAAGYLARLGGTMNEGLVDGELRQAWFAQPSGLSVGEDGRVWLADDRSKLVVEFGLIPPGDGVEVRYLIDPALFDVVGTAAGLERLLDEAARRVR